MGRKCWRLCLWLAALLTLSTATNITGTPNIVFFLADDMGYGDAGYLSTAPGHRRLLTPNLDRMVKEGMAFTDAYAGAPVCAPSRCTLITGRHSGHCTVRSNGPTLSDKDVGVAQVLKKAGYRTIHIGKWGLGGMTSAASPMAKGFDEYYGQIDQAYCHNYYPSYMDSNRNTSRQIGLKEKIPQNQEASESSCGPDRVKCLWSGDDWTDVATRWLAKEGERRKLSATKSPFFMYLSYTAPHAGGVGTNKEGQPPVPRISSGPYVNSSFGKEIGYATAVTMMDEQLGLYFAALEKAGLQADTLTFFTSDNGASNEGNHDYKYFTSSGPLKGYKRSLHEGGHRAAFVGHWPGYVPAGVVSRHQVAFWDFLATAADFAQVSSKDLPEHDGISAKPTLLGLSQDQRPFVYHEYCAPNEKKNGWGQSVRAGNWSAVCVGATLSSGNVPACSQPLLYDLGTDVGQTTDVASQHPDEVKKLMDIMREQHTYNNYCGASAPPSPPAPPSAPVELRDLSGDWVQHSSNKPAMKIDVTNMSADNTTASVTLTCVAPCSCCKWNTATGIATKSAAGTTLQITATGPQSFSTKEQGVATASGISIAVAWKGGKNWAQWTRAFATSLELVV